LGLRLSRGFQRAKIVADAHRACFPRKRSGNHYAGNRASFRSGEIRILDSTGEVERMIAFPEADRKL
jgi:hypothetical protein